MAGGDEEDRRPDHVNRSRSSGPADLVQARDVYGGVHFHSGGTSSVYIPPRELPGDVRGFVNRVEELGSLNQLLAGEALDVGLSVICGTAGVGKTALALRWAHAVRERFPDGQLYANLRGYDPGQPSRPEEVLDRFLRALGIPPSAVPADLDDRAALYRSRLSDRRVLVLLDNAATVRQVRPLLPGTSSCLVIVTSRSKLSGLVSRDGGRRLTLPMLSDGDAVKLLHEVTADYRAGDDPEELAELARLCARLPLALRIAAERAASRPFMPLAELIQDLRDESALWDALTTEEGEEADAVRTVFAWSYRALSLSAALLFRLLGLHPGPDVSAPAAAALAGVPVTQVRQPLDALVGAHLLEQGAPGRYQLHDLLRAYAIDQARHLESEESRQAALARVLAWYLHTADAALGRSLPFYRTERLEPPTDITPLAFTDAGEADAWLVAEQDNLVAATRAAADAGLPRIAWRLAVLLRSVFMHRNAFDGWFTTARIGLAAARTLGDRRAEAEALESLGKAHFQARRLAEAEDSHRAALAIRREIGDEHGTAVSVNALGLLALRHRRLDDALTHFGESLDIFIRRGDRRWRALLLSNLGETRYELGDLDDAVSLLEQALAVQRDIDDRGQEGNSLFFLSMALRELGRTGEALTAIEAALAIAENGSPLWLAHWLVEYSRVQRALGSPTSALEAAHRAATIQRRLGDLSREAMALDEAGEGYRELGQPEEAIAFHRRAAAVHRQLGDDWQLAVTLDHLATALAGIGQAEEAHRCWDEATRILTRFPDPRAERLRARVASAAQDNRRPDREG
ncbi:tetratricopeptide repeat protein [Micromonospora sp. WMMC241]|uniref:ATP-binding protein n=1 Tax=Micromonospora sp. WMMC241 TaxID=3015159 RepID=UPI0022B683E8|nr:tetratricopeptide repeat protein [Micromonospora sp. WMMC241]MCZ7437725.1 tetratricopeptide repeat protein [Micromonospora sp. WMMC241]